MPVVFDDNKITFEQAAEFVKSLAQPGERWLAHSEKTAEVAFRVAGALKDAGLDVDPDEVSIMAVFHDVGRSRGHGHLHGWSGFEMLKEKGLARYAKACVSHWLKGRDVETVLREGSVLDEDFVRHVFRETGCGDFSLAEKIVSLADSMTIDDVVTTVRERYREARGRYGDSEWMATNERISLEIKSEFDSLLKSDAYGLFPEIGRAK